MILKSLAYLITMYKDSFLINIRTSDHFTIPKAGLHIPLDNTPLLLLKSEIKLK